MRRLLERHRRRCRGCARERGLRESCLDNIEIREETVGEGADSSEVLSSAVVIRNRHEPSAAGMRPLGGIVDIDLCVPEQVIALPLECVVLD